MKKVYTANYLSLKIFITFSLIILLVMEGKSNNLPFSLGVDTTLCAGDTLFLDAPIQDDTLSYLWSNGDTIPSLAITEAGTYQLTIFSDSCQGRDTIEVNFDSLPEINLSADSVCVGDTIDIINDAPFSSTYNYIWDTGDGNIFNTTSNSIAHLYEASEDGYTAQLTITKPNGCTNTDSVAIILTPFPEIDLSADSACIGTGVTLVNNAPFDPKNNYIWSTGDGNNFTVNGSSITHLYEGNEENYTAYLTIATTNGCTSVDSTQINFKPLPDIALSVDTVCFRDSVHFIDNTLFHPTSTYIWETGDGGTFSTNSNSYTHLYSGSGTSYTAILTINAANGCINMDTAQVTFKPLPEFDIQTNDVCFGETTFFVNDEPFNPLDTFIWDMGDGNIFESNSNTFEYVYAENGMDYLASLTILAANGCTDRQSFIISSKLTPNVSFIVDSVCVGRPVTITNNSENVAFNAIFNFDYGDNNTATTGNMMSYEYLYGSALTYDIEIIVDNRNGCLDTSQLTTLIRPLPNVEFEGLEENYCFNDPQVTLEGSPAGGQFFGIGVSDGPGSTSFFNPSDAVGSNITITYFYKDEHNCSSNDSEIVAEVYSPLNLSFIYPDMDNTFCFDSIAMDTIGVNLPGGQFFLNDYPAQNTIADSLVIFIPSDTGSFVLSYEITDLANGCRNILSESIIVNSVPNFTLGPDTDIGPGDSTILSPGISNPDFTYLWSTGVTTPDLTVQFPGFYILTITNPITGCAKSDTINVDFASPVNEIDFLSSLHYFPNPAISQITISLSAIREKQATLQVFDALGQPLLNQAMHLHAGQEQLIQLDVSSFSPGLYFFSIGQQHFSFLVSGE